ncbi:Titin [Blattella germanica]|nr:Titin [Blattella germanica]
MEYTLKEEVVLETQEGDLFFSVSSYVAENSEAINLVEGERVYVLEHHSSDWWFVKKHLTEEKGLVPAQVLLDGPTYTAHVQKKVHEKIDKLPVFEKPTPGEQATAPRFVQKLQPKHTQDGTTIQFECQVEGNPRPQITWFKETSVLLPSQDFQIFYDDDNVATLIVKEVFPEDAGMFTCVAKNAAGFASSTTELIVEAPVSDHGSDQTITISRKSLSRESSLADILEGIPPMFSKKPKARCVDEGTEVELESRLVAVPEPEVTWYYNGKEIKSSGNVTIISESDMHMYTSIVKTGEKEPPQILEPLKSIKIDEGESVVLSTQVVGNPSPTVTWLKNGKPAPDLPVRKDGDTYTLTLIESTPEDTAQYTVAAKNPVGTAETTATLVVEELPYTKPEPPLFLERFEEEKVPEKGTLRLLARVTGNPTPKIMWLRNNEALVPSDTVAQTFDGETAVLEIRNADSEVDAGDYKCIASNPAGISSHGARVIVDVDKVTFTKNLKQMVTVDEQTTLSLECETSHSISTKWFHNGKEISGMDHREVIHEGRLHRLVINKVTAHDAGTYKCSVKNQTTESKVTVKELKPDFIRKLQDFEVKERESAILEVEISSETADVTWHKDGEQIQHVEDKFIFEKKGNIRRLFIRGTSVHDEGEYTCALGEQECTAEVSVVELPPEIITKMQDVTIAKGEKATFEIELTKGDALVRWFKDGTELQFSEHVQLSIDGKRQKLKVYNSELEDSGVYSCQVGEQTSSATLKVEEPVVDFITRLPDVTLIPLNADATFTVELSRPDVEVKWLKKGKVLKESERHIITSEGTVRKLVIKKVTLEDQMDYSCVAVNVKTTSKLKVEIIETAPKINLDILQKEYRVKKGEDVTIEVKYTSTPPPTDEWFVNGTLVKKSKRITQTLTETSASLTIKKVEESDVGNYTIKLANNCGEASAELTLILMEAPSKPGMPEVIEITDTTITLHWKAPERDGNSPIINYVLEYHDKSDFTWIKVNEDFNIVETTHKVVNLVHNVEYMFKVTAFNDIGPSPPSDPTRYIKITAPVAAEPPVIQEPLKSIVSGLKQSVTLSCVIGGIPEPQIKWLRDGRSFKNKNITYENRIAKYVITETTENSAGTYTCQATNDAGYAETTCELKIQETPRLEVDENVVSQKLRITNQWKIEVKFSGYPQPEVSWTKDGEDLPSTKHCAIYNDESSTTIAIYSLTKEDTGTYTVMAKNVAGSASIDLNLRVIDKPSKPEGPMVVKDIRKESVTIEWKPPADDGGLELSKYSVEKCDVEKMVWMKVADVEKDVSSYCVQRLREDAEYMFRVIAENPVGTSEALESDTVTIRSKFDKPSPPRGPFDVSGMTDTSFTLAWQPSETDGGSPLIEYIVERREVNKKAWQKIGVTTAEETSIEVTGLKANTSYHFRVTARNDIGSSVPYAPEEPITAGKRIRYKRSKSTVGKTLLAFLGAFPTTGIKVDDREYVILPLGSPSAPTNLSVADITSKSVTLQWGPPITTGGTELTGYIIEMRLISAKSWTKVVTLDPSVTQHCIENLKEKSELFFRVYAENSMGLSPPACTEIVSLKTHAKSYTIAIRDIRKTMWMEVGRVKADIQKLTIKDLQENHEYLIRIFARNEVGLSDPLESEEPFKVLRPTAETTAPTLSFSTETTTSWMKEAGMDADIHSYARGSLLRRDEYFFRIWYYARQLFK